jgi:hypothetical protein
VLWWCGCSICACACGFDLAPSSQLRAPRVANLGENSARFVRAGGGGTADVIYLLGGVVEVFVWSMLRTKVLLVCFYQHCWRLRMSIFFLKALLEHCCSLFACSPCLRRRPWFSSCRRSLEKFLSVSVCAYVCSTALVCPTALDLASVVNSGCFAAIAFFLGGCFAVSVAGLLLADTLLLRVSWLLPAADALPQGVSSPLMDALSSMDPWRMLCCHWPPLW